MWIQYLIFVSCITFAYHFPGKCNYKYMSEKLMKATDEGVEMRGRLYFILLCNHAGEMKAPRGQGFGNSQERQWMFASPSLFSSTLWQPNTYLRGGPSCSVAPWWFWADTSRSLSTTTLSGCFSTLEQSFGAEAPHGETHFCSQAVQILRAGAELILLIYHIYMW